LGVPLFLFVFLLIGFMRLISHGSAKIMDGFWSSYRFLQV